jgi:hypothetical protein
MRVFTIPENKEFVETLETLYNSPDNDIDFLLCHKANTDYLFLANDEDSLNLIMQQKDSTEVKGLEIADKMQAITKGGYAFIGNEILLNQLSF